MTGRAQRAGRPEADAPGALLERIARATVAAWGQYASRVGTLPAFRRRGLGELVSRAATNAAFEQGADIVALEASSMARPLYSKLGCETVGIDQIWLPPSD